MGLPVISTIFNGATEIMTDGVHGYVLKDPTDIDVLVDAMRKMLDPDRRRTMREACLALRPKLSYEHHLDQLTAIYDRAIALRAPGRAGRGPGLG
jgi:UDP-glucose:(heptosyl)LPS alpha-1,3-glucosyltransferase